MNLLFSEGEHLFAYHDRAGYTGLCHTHRKTPFEKVTLCDEDWSANLPEEKKPSQHGYVIATKPLTDGEKWTKFDRGELIVFKGGKPIYAT
jgi:glutamine amidotransferase